jgi:DNA-binding transcriptional MerR regulator
VEDGLKIGQLARRLGVTAKTIRFYEAERVLPPPTRSSNGYRLYGQDAVEMLTFIMRATGLGLTLAEIREIIAIRRGGRPPCRHVHALLERKAEELDRKLRDLLVLRQRVRASLAAWRRTPRRRATVCPHVEGRERR